MSNIFISYRREDAAASAGRLCDHLNRLTGADRVFMDVEDITPGQRFVETIDKTMAGCDVVLIVIGPKWADILRERAQLPKPDFVAHEIEAALARQITIVPVLVGGATIACLDNLPGKLSTLSQYEVAELRDNTFTEDCERLAKSLKLRPAEPGGGNKIGAKKVAAIAAGVVLLVLAWMGYRSWSAERGRKAALDPVFATAKSQAERGEYESAFFAYQGLLNNVPGDRAAMEAQVDAAMGWLEDFHVILPEGGNASGVAGPKLDQILPVMDAALARSGGKSERAADILAHIGWAHWLNQHVAQREFGPAAERDLRKALEIDPANVVAHAMLGNWMLQNGGKTEDALEHFRRAEETKKARPFVRQLELGVLAYPRDEASRAELIRVANEMRKNGEPLDEHMRRRILSSYSPTVNSAEEIAVTLKAAPPADAWATYQWLEQGGSDEVQRNFIHASILEIDGKREEALADFQGLRAVMKQRGYNGRIASYVDAAIERLAVR